MRLRYFLPVYLFAYFFVAFFWRSYIVWKRTGVNPVTFKSSDSAHDFIGRVFKLVLALVAVVVLVYSVLPHAYKYTLPLHWLERSWVRWIGLTLLFISSIWTLVAQVEMGKSWRVGIDTEHLTPLVQTGIFRISRNPIFLGIILTLVGLFLLIPNGLTMLALVMSVVLIGVQVRLEEEHLTRTHSDEYMSYRRRVRRWL
jgi:protein-S-isoprenylcysteine O-methyltransferase Ste14